MAEQSLVGRLFGWMRPKAQDEPVDPPEFVEGDDGARWELDPNTTWAQVLDFANEGVFAGTVPTITRARAVTYAPLNRCVSLVSGIVACLLTNGELYVVDRDRKRVNTARTRRVLDMLADSVDGGLTPSFSFFEDAVADYCLDGNGLFAAVGYSDGVPSALRRYSPSDSEMIYGRQGEPAYRLTGADGQIGTTTAPAREVIHVRWPRLGRHDRANKPRREGFATAPIAALAPALNIGLQGDDYISNWFREGSKSKTHFNLRRPEGGKPLSPAERRKLRAWVLRQTKKRDPVITEDMDSSQINEVPQDRQAAALREFQVRQVSMVYGMPSIVVGGDITNWGSGIEQLAKLLYRFGGKQHLDRFLAPMSLVLLSRGQRFRTRATDLTRGDTSALREFVTSMGGDAQRPPYATREEIRDMADLSKDPDGEYVTVEPANDNAESNGRANEPMTLPV